MNLSIFSSGDCICMVSMGSVEPVDFEVLVLEPRDFENFFSIKPMNLGTYE